MRDELLRQSTRIVIKVGSSLVASRDTGLRPEQIDRLADEIAALRSSGREVLIVSSGAIVSGIKKLGLKEYPKSLPVKQAAAAVGQSRLMWAYEKSFERLDVKVAQILLTHHDLADRRRFLNARHTLSALIRFGVIPIINENDTVAVDEIRVGDNDTLAAEVAHLVDAELLIILSDIDGLFTEDPRKNPAATLIPLIPDITKEIEERAGVSTTFEGTGGMATKIRAAKKVSEYGVATLILNGQEAGLLPHVLAGGSGGSLFLAKERRFSSRKHWIAFTLLGLLGLHMIYAGLKPESEGAATDAAKRMHGFWSLAATGLATSIDAMAVGVGLAFLDVNIGVVALVIGLTTLVMVTLGIMLGRILGSLAGKRAEIIGGFMLIAIGAAILYEHLSA